MQDHTSPPDPSQQAEWPRLLAPKHIEYLKIRGVRPEEANARGYRTVWSGKRDGSGQYAADYEFTQKSSGLLIPLHPILGGEAYQLRLDAPVNGRKFMTPQGQMNVLSTSPLGRDALLKPTDPNACVFICEGVTRVDVLTGLGESAVGLTGVYGWRGKREGTRFSSITEDLEALPRVPHYVLAVDGDYDTNRYVRVAVDRLAAYLVKSRRAEDVWRIALPTEEGLDDYVGRRRLDGLSDTDIKAEIVKMWVEVGVVDNAKAAAKAVGNQNQSGDLTKWQQREIHALATQAWQMGALVGDGGLAERFLSLYGNGIVLATIGGDGDAMEETRTFRMDERGVLVYGAQDMRTEMVQAGRWYVEKVLQTGIDVSKDNWRQFHSVGRGSVSQDAQTRAVKSMYAAAHEKRYSDLPTLREILGIRVVRESDINEQARYIGAGNGLLDLMESRLLTRDEVIKRGVLVSRSIPTDFRPDAPRVEAVDKLFATYGVAADGVMMYLGRALYGDPPEAMLLLYGPKNSGKSTLVGALQTVLGQGKGGAQTAMSSALDAERYSNSAHNDELAPFHDASIVLMEEVQDARWANYGNPAKLKRMTGGPNIWLMISRKSSQGRQAKLHGFLIALGNNPPESIGLHDPAVQKRLRPVKVQSHKVDGKDNDPKVRAAFYENSPAAQDLLRRMVEAAKKYPPGSPETDDEAKAPEYMRSWREKLTADNKPLFVKWAEKALVPVNGLNVNANQIWTEWLTIQGWASDFGKEVPKEWNDQKRSTLMRQLGEYMPQLGKQTSVKVNGVTVPGYKGFRLLRRDEYDWAEDNNDDAEDDPEDWMR